MGHIRLLESNIAAQIAAGEVIERPVSVVKELLENALDAGATDISLDVVDGGLGLIRLTDNGHGIAKDDLPMAFKRHATSKITLFNDLFNLSSFGFRGEALASMAAISQVRAVSGKDTQTPAWSYEINGGTEGVLKAAPPLKGTMIEIRNLFYNVPARRKFMKSNTQETGRIRHMVAMMSLARPDVTFRLTSQQETVFQTTNLHTTEERIVLVYGEACKGHMLEVPETEIHPNYFVKAWLSDATVTRANRQDINCFVNGRYVHSKELQQIVETAYYSFIPADRFPLAVVQLQVPPEAVDVNVHPAKTTVQLVQPERWREAFIDLLKDTLWHSTIATRLTRAETSILEAPPHAVEMPGKDSFLVVAETPAAETPPFTSFLRMKEPSGQKQSLFAAPQTVYNAPDQPFFTPNEPMGAVAETEGPVQTLAVKDVTDLTLIGQLQNTFILAQNDAGLYIIDQHTCHERILYERFQSALNKEDIIMQTFLLPVSIHLSPLQDSLLMSHILHLRDLGFVFEQSTPGQVQMLSIPALLSHITDYQGLVDEVLSRLDTNETMSLSTLQDAIITGAACKGAVKANAKLSHEEMTHLLEDLSATQNAHTCPHGRPIIMTLTMTELYRYFKRGQFEGKP